MNREMGRALDRSIRGWVKRCYGDTGGFKSVAILPRFVLCKVLSYLGTIGYLNDKLKRTQQYARNLEKANKRYKEQLRKDYGMIQKLKNKVNKLTGVKICGK